MRDNEIHKMVGDHYMAIIFNEKDPKRKRALTQQYYQQVAEIAATMSPADAQDFRSRVSAYQEEWLRMAQSEMDRAEAVNPLPLPHSQTYKPRRQSSYIGRTVTRAVVWNIVNSLFRVFR